MKKLILLVFLTLFSYWVTRAQEENEAELLMKVQISLDSIPPELVDSEKLKQTIHNAEKYLKDISSKKQMLQVKKLSHNLRNKLDIESMVVEEKSSGNRPVKLSNSSPVSPETEDKNSKEEIPADTSLTNLLEEQKLQLLKEQEEKTKAQIANMHRSLDLKIKAVQLQKLKTRNLFYASSGALVLLFAVVIMLYRSNITKKKNNKLLEEEKKKTEIERDKSDELLLNIFPPTIAHELKTKGKTQVRHYELASVLFTDFKGFTTIAEKMNPAALVAELDLCFAKFDEIITKHNLEKIKTIGDAYMCAGGLPKANQSNPVDIVLAGLEIQLFMKRQWEEKKQQGQEYWKLRLGINSGELIAGVIGKKKFAYDIWGDTVNTASRMESSGETGEVNISGNTYQLVKDFFVCEYRGKIAAKNKGEIDMYFIKGIKPELSVRGEGKEPNTAFHEMVSVPQ